ncbi:MAG: hypothetical protein HQL14_08600 [Candidatus Omnitrophica bacterium]|nr:hypothetical protein [Candidatus Omnitrophota bacterium]
MSLIPEGVIIKDLFQEMKPEDDTVCGQCGYMDCVCTLGKDYQYDFFRSLPTAIATGFGPE